MRKFYEKSMRESTWNKAQEFEQVFVLLGRDKAAPHAIRAWANERISLGLNTPGDDQIKAAIHCAESMEIEQAQPTEPGSVNIAVDSPVQQSVSGLGVQESEPIRGQYKVSHGPANG